MSVVKPCTLNLHLFFLITTFLNSKTFIFFKNTNLNDLKVYLPFKDYNMSLTKIKLSTITYYPQSLDLFNYQVGWSGNSITCVSLYIHKLLSNLNVFFCKTNTPGNSTSYAYSAESIFFNFWWLEREVSELSNISFICKSDARNLLLEYSNVTKPQLRNFPSAGLFELYFDFIYQVVLQVCNSVQF